MNVLVTSASRKVSLIRAFQQALAQEGGGRVVGVDVSPLAPALYAADEHHLVPRSDAPDFVPALLDLCRRREIALVVPTRDEELPVFARHRADFEAAGTRVMVASEETLRRCQDKLAFAEFCAANGFLTPRLVSREEALSTAAFPLFAKPRVGKGGLHATRLRERAELVRLLEVVPDPVIQEFIDAPEFTVDLFADFDGRVISAVPRERVLVACGESVISRTTRDPRIIESSVALAGALGLVGHNTLQCFVDREAVLFIEVNPRFGGAASLGFAAGAHTPRFLVQLLRDGAVAPRIGDFRDRLYMLRHTTDLFLEEGALAAPHA